MEKPEELEEPVTNITKLQALKSAMANNAELRDFIMHGDENASITIELGIFTKIPLKLARQVLFKIALENHESSVSH